MVGAMAGREVAWLAIRRLIQTCCSWENGGLSAGVADEKALETARVVVVTVLSGATLTVVVLLPGGLGAAVTGALELGAVGAMIDGVTMTSCLQRRGYLLEGRKTTSQKTTEMLGAQYMHYRV